MRVFSSIVQPAPHLPAIDIAQFLHRRRIRSKAIGDDLLNLTMLFQCLLEEPYGRRFVPFLGDVALQDFALVIDGPPQVVRLAVDVRFPALRVTNTSSRRQRQ